ncbi:MAG: hypothetical protein ACM335_06985, partial [Deltaproteobacteria bacterium]
NSPRPAGRGLFRAATIYGLLVERRSGIYCNLALSPALVPGSSVIPSPPRWASRPIQEGVLQTVRVLCRLRSAEANPFPWAWLRFMEGARQAHSRLNHEHGALRIDEHFQAWYDPIL